MKYRKSFSQNAGTRSFHRHYISSYCQPHSSPPVKMTSDVLRQTAFWFVHPHGTRPFPPLPFDSSVSLPGTFWMIGYPGNQIFATGQIPGPPDIHPPRQIPFAARLTSAGNQMPYRQAYRNLYCEKQIPSGSYIPHSPV